MGNKQTVCSYNNCSMKLDKTYKRKHMYCLTHKCTYSSCKNSKYYNSNFCSNHKCVKAYCQKEAVFMGRCTTCMYKNYDA